MPRKASNFSKMNAYEAEFREARVHQVTDAGQQANGQAGGFKELTTGRRIEWSKQDKKHGS
eukprot:2898935-Pleurochrysis_carterae.AAC.2